MTALQNATITVSNKINIDQNFASFVYENVRDLRLKKFQVSTLEPFYKDIEVSSFRKNIGRNTAICSLVNMVDINDHETGGYCAPEDAVEPKKFYIAAFETAHSEPRWTLFNGVAFIISAAEPLGINSITASQIAKRKILEQMIELGTLPSWEFDLLEVDKETALAVLGNPEIVKFSFES